MNTTLFNAAEAKKTANSLNNEVNERLFKKVAEKIQNAAVRGQLKISVSLSELTDPIITHLSTLGYRVTKTSGDPCSGGSQYLINWE